MSDSWMGSLAAQDQYRELGNDPWSNTMRGTTPAPGQGFAPVQQSPVLYNTKAGPITEADIGGAIDIGMGVSGGGLKTDIVKAPGIKAYHSSPHDFLPEPGYPLGRFDLSKIGTGEGAQVIGHGLYFAENPAVSGQGGQYWSQFTHRFPDQEMEMAETLKRFGFDRERAAAEAQKHIDMLERKFKGNPILGSGGAVDKEIAKRRAEIDTYASGQPIGPRTYEVNINADPAHMLDWDKPLREQSQLQRDAARRLGMLRDEYTGSEVYKTAAMNKRAEGASSALREAGIPGIKYLDQGSRGAGTGSSNYVIFDPNIIDIMKKYGLAGAAPAGMGALAAQDTYQSDRGM